MGTSHTNLWWLKVIPIPKVFSSQPQVAHRMGGSESEQRGHRLQRHVVLFGCLEELSNYFGPGAWFIRCSRYFNNPSILYISLPLFTYIYLHVPFAVSQNDLNVGKSSIHGPCRGYIPSSSVWKDSSNKQQTCSILRTKGRKELCGGSTRHTPT